MIKITGLNKAEVLKVLFNNSKVQGFNAMLGLNPPDITTEEAFGILKEYETKRGEIYFDYLNGKVMKIDLTSDDEFEEWLYDRDNGEGAAQRAIDSIKTE